MSRRVNDLAIARFNKECQKRSMQVVIWSMLIVNELHYEVRLEVALETV